VDEVLVREERDDGVVVLRLNRPKANALSRELLGAIAGAFDEMLREN
jgi:enoyl-CoA hydratase/carnithine racemase